ncbi:MAG: hypothetical protein LBM73_00985 [Candidatus Nomurabacteria bacterium]|jgi:hypothetical protein|nr:hypothetical protein [Candidatus Nomurabacteria bacterium]
MEMHAISPGSRLTRLIDDPHSDFKVVADAMTIKEATSAEVLALELNGARMSTPSGRRIYVGFHIKDCAEGTEATYWINAKRTRFCGREAVKLRCDKGIAYVGDSDVVLSTKAIRKELKKLQQGETASDPLPI